MIRLFGHFLSKTYLLLGLLEFLIFLFALSVGFYSRSGMELPYFDTPGVDNYWGTAILYALILTSSMTSVGLYQPGLKFGASLMVRLGLGFLFASMVMSLLFYGLPHLFLGRGVMAMAMIYSIIGVLLLRPLFFRFVGSDAQNHRVLVLGTGQNAAMIHDLVPSPDASYRIVGYLQLDDRELTIPESDRLPKSASILDTVVANEVDELVVAVDDRRRSLPVDEILDCKMSGIRVLDLLSFFEKETSRINIDILHPSWIFFSSGFRLGGVGQYIKRLMDIILSLLMLMLGLPFMLLVALAVMVESGWGAPVLYRQTRVGLNGKPFTLFKFRSMCTDAEADGTARWACVNDDRITRVGSFTRKTRLDELPQLFNVLRGEMSLVGPRPERPEFVEQLQRQIPYYSERHRVRPGITGWAQLCYQYGSTPDDAKQKLQYDLYYVKNASLFLDLIILLETVEVVLWRKGAR